MLIALLGIMKAGAAAVPLDPLYPAERLSLMLGDADVTIVIGQDVGSSAHRIDLTRDRQTIAAQPTSRPAVESAPDDLLFITFTSGSTGIPKGVLMTQRIFANMLVWGHGQGFAAPARTLQFAPLTFDVSLQEIYTCWTCGGSLVLIDDERRRDSAALLAFLLERRIERLFVPSIALQSLAETAAGAAVEKLALKQIIAAGEQLRLTSQLADLVARLDGCELHNQYGPSETYALTAYRMTGSPSRWPSLPPIGEAVAGARLYVLDAHGHLVPPGFPGELYAGGIVIGPGYANRAELTSERFVPAPFGGEGLLYRTGDLVRLRADGNYEFLGRNDAQLKIRGFRVEPAEIELVLTRHAAVAQAAIVADDRQRLVAYVVAAAGATMDAAVLRAHVESTLPPYMLPSAFVVLDALPLTSNGKLNKRALPMPVFTDAAAPAQLAPRTATEDQLARIWRELLGLASVGITESFFDVGGHSLLATRLTSRILATFGVTIPLKRLFETPTIAGIAAMVDASGPRTPASAIPRAPRRPDMPCSFAQERLWYLSALQQHDATYNMPGALRLRGVLDVAALAAALGDLVDRHEVLRTRLIERGGRIVQDIVPNATPDLTVSDLSDWPIGDREAQVSSRINEFARRPFDLARDLPCRFALLRCGPAEHILLIAVHHAAADGWSLGIIAREVTALYASNLSREPSMLPALPIQYADFAAWQRDWLTGENCAALRDYWKVQLAGAPMRPTLPASRPRPLRRSFRGATLPFTVNRALTERLRAAAKEHNVTLYTMLLTAYAATLHRLSGQADFVIATPTAGRSRPEIEPLVGLFVNLLPIRIRISESDTLASLIGRVRDTILDAFSHEALPFEKIVEDFAPERNLSGQTPLSEVVFALQNWPHQPLRMAGLTIVPEIYESFAAKHDLTLSMDDTIERLSGTMDYATDLFELEAVEQMITSFVDCLETVADSIDAPLLEAGTASAAIQTDDFAFNESLSDD
jgi:amino acid adenylation domain-containing protein